MNFSDIYKKIRSINEDAPVIMATQQPDNGIEECGDMMPHPSQQDNVDMNITIHGSGSGGIRDLMSILRDIEGKDSNGEITVDPQADDLEVMIGDMEEEYGNSVHGASGAHTASIQDVTNVGTTTNGGDHKPRQAGLPQANAHSMQETVVDRLSSLYQKIKEQDVTEQAKYRDPKYKDKLYTQEPRDPHDDYHDDDYYNPKPDDYPGAKHVIGGGEFDHNDPLRKGYGRHGSGSMNTHGKRKGMPSRDHISSLKGSIKTAHGAHTRPNLPEQVNESAEINAMLALNKQLNG